MTDTSPSAKKPSDSIDNSQQLIEIVADLRDEVAKLRDEVADLHDENEQLRDEVADLHDENEQLRDEIDARARADAEDRKRLTEAEDRLDAVEERLTSDRPQGSDGKKQAPAASVTPETPLEQTATLPEEMIEDESANVQRAVFVAKDVKDYTTSCPAGRVIKSSELRTVLKAGTDARGHSQTVDRVMTILDDLGGEDVKIVDRRGERRVVFDDDLTERLGQLTSDEEPSHDVVTEEAV